jgi:hypothetical protein
MSEVKEVTAWAVVDKDGKLDIGDIDIHPDPARAKWLDKYEPSNAPHRVIRVRIVPDTEEQK